MNLCGVLRRECLRPVDDGGRAGVAPFWSGVLGGRFLSKNSGERGAPKRTRFFLDACETSTSPESTENTSMKWVGEAGVLLGPQWSSPTL